MNLSRREQVYLYIQNKTQQLIAAKKIDHSGVDALSCAIDLKLDRANVSKELNELWRDGKIIKIQGRPVYYLSYQTLSDHFPNCYIPSIICKNDCLSNYLKEKPEVKEISVHDEIDPLDSLIGSDGSLSDLILKAKSAVSYPPYGLHTLILGNDGVGKTQLALSMFKYAVKKGYKQKESPFLTLDCRNYAQDTAAFAAVLLGEEKNYQSKKALGLLEKSKGGVLLLEQVDCLGEASLYLLCSIMNHGYYTHLGGSVTYPTECMILATAKNHSALMQNDMEDQIPIVLKLSDLEERGMYEKLQIILDLFSKEARRIAHPIHIHKDIITCFAMMEYKNNITQLRHEIKIACSRAFLDMEQNPYSTTVYLNFHHLSQTMLAFGHNNSHLKPEIISMLSPIESNFLSFGKNEPFNINTLLEPRSQYFFKVKIHEFIDTLNLDIDTIDDIESYSNEIINSLKKYEKFELQALKSNINPIVYQVVITHLLHFPKYKPLLGHEHLLYGILLRITHVLKRYENYENDSAPFLIKERYPEEFSVAINIFNYFNSIYNLRIKNKEIDLLACYLAVSYTQITQTNISILVICHGDCIASQMVDFVKSSIPQKVEIDAINFKDTCSLEEVLDLACSKAKDLNQGVGVLLCCDMEPLTSLSDIITRNTGIPSKTIKSISLPKLLCIVQESLNGINVLDSFQPEIEATKKQSDSSEAEPSFISQVIQKIISKTTSFIDTQRAVDILMFCLQKILQDLSIPYHDEIATKYLIHCVNMLERVIRNQPWEYSRINTFIENNATIFHIVEKNLEYASNRFDIVIPSSEIAYITEIFIALN